jgi:NitT/TauT family transport system ATP-binding protein
MPSKIEIRDLGKTYQTRHGSVRALENVDLTVDEGEFLCLIGPSGSGKSTLLRILAGIYRQSTGSVTVYGSAEEQNARNAVVFQEYAIFPWRTVIDNIAFGLEMRGSPRKERLETAQRYLDTVGLTEFADHYPYQLSGGMKQRVALARALATDPDILLMDEPFGALDAQTRLVLQEELLRIWEADQKTVVYVTHSIEEAIILGYRVVVMTARPGRIKSELQVDLPRPRELRVRTTVHFGRLAQKLWEELSGEVSQAMALAHDRPETETPMS